MTTSESRFGVWLQEMRAGTLSHRGDFTWFTLDEQYIQDGNRPVLGLIFEEDVHGRHASAMRLPSWFANLLPEGRLREWIAFDSGVSIQREMELLAHVGHDLPGAVRVLPEDQPPEQLEVAALPTPLHYEEGESVWRFSLAGVGMKFSMLRQADRLTLPAHGQGGDWIVKMPDPGYADVPLNEYAMMNLADRSGINVPDCLMVSRDELTALPNQAWMGSEVKAYAVKRFDRRADGSRVHIEDFAQVRNFPPDWKYRGTLETVGAYCYRRHDLAALEEFVRRVTFNILISNGDAHLKNWSLIYLNPQSPTLSPAYDLVSTALYAVDRSAAEDLGLKLGKSRRFEVQRVEVFERLGSRIGVDGVRLEAVAVETVERVSTAWPEIEFLLRDAPLIRSAVSSSIEASRKSLLSRAG